MEIKIFKDTKGNEFRYREIAITNKFAQSRILDNRLFVGEIDDNGKVNLVQGDDTIHKELEEGDIIPTELNREYLRFVEMLFPTDEFETMTDDELAKEIYIWFGIDKYFK